MKKTIYFFLLISLISCGKITPKGKIESTDHKVEDFVNIDLDGKFRAFFIKSDSSYINIETYKNIGQNVKFQVKDKTLTITEKRETSGVDFYNITIYSRYNLEKVALADSVEMNTSSEIKTDNFKINLKKNAKFIGSLNSRTAEVEMTQKSRANFTGQTKNATIKITDTASLIAPYWKIENLKINSTKGNYAEVNVKDSLKGEIKNTSKLLYYNDPIRAFKIDKTATVNSKILE